ncbi:hypothetical protein [uncultured Parvibaculum sp.]|uniref:hypothetical protein n=1 Tax=uncultured Parvibaculum sp. TaxID=291828 RepID=UPI0030D8D765|tara:strand:- start:14439 stop:14804 length:366 start_codon:yes stop_codon:yes gene_type:complete
MSDEPIAPYVSKGIDAGEELEALGTGTAELFLMFMDSIVVRKRNYKRDQAFDTYRGHTIYKAEEHDGRFIIYVVEEQDDDSLRVTLIHAGCVADFMPHPDSIPTDLIKAHVVPRLEDFFDG